MNFNLRMLVSFGLAVLLHCLAALAAVLSCGSCNAGWVPDFMTGESSLELSVAARMIDPPPAPRLIASGYAPVLMEPEAILTASPAEALPDTQQRLTDERELSRLDAPSVPAEAAAPEDEPASEPALETSGADLERGVIGAVRLSANVAPYYPLGARMRGEEGVVRVRVEVNPDGSAASCAIERSSGFPALDQAALHAARRARYVSAQPAAQAAHGRIELDFRFQLTD